MQKAIIDFMMTIPSEIYLLILSNFFAMMVDFLIGSFIAFFKKDITFKSQIGIFGILRKMISMVVIVLFVFIGLSLDYYSATFVKVSLFSNIGKSAVYLLLFGYLFFECWSVYEHYKVIENTRANLLKPIINIIKKVFESHDK